MTTGAGSSVRRPSLGEAIVCLAVFAVAIPLAAPHFVEMMRSPLGLAFALGLCGWLLRRRAWDAVLLALPIAVGASVDMEVGSLMVALPCAAVFVLTRRPRFAAVAGSALVALLVIGIRMKERFAGTVLTWHDLKYFLLKFGDNVGVLASQPTLLAYSAALLGAVGGVGWFCWRLDREAVHAARPVRQLAGALVALLLAGWCLHLLRDEMDRLARQDAWSLGGMGSHGEPLSGFLGTAGHAPRWTPRVTDTAAFGRRVRQQMAAAPAAAKPADIVLILQESQFNPATIDGCPPGLCRADVFQPQAQIVSQGPLKVNVFGGGTWLSEFALETGVPHTAFGPGGDFTPFNVAPGVRRSFARSLKAAGYRTVAVYPVGGGMMNARTAYAAYGFDRFLDSDDLRLSGSYATSDRVMHAVARRVLEEERRHGQPVFLMLVTIFNHGQHGARMDRVPPLLVEQASARFPQENVATNVADYVWRTREFGRALEDTRAAVIDRGPPAVLAWFGDHQPPFGNALALRDAVRSEPTPGGTVPARFQTWYQVRSNVDHLPREASLRRMDVSFLPGLLAQAAGARLDEWLAANVVARQECDGVLEGCARPDSGAAYLSYLWKDLREFELR